MTKNLTRLKTGLILYTFLYILLGLPCSGMFLNGQVQQDLYPEAPIPGTVTQNEIPTQIRVQIPNSQLNGQTTHELSAIGVLYNTNNGIILYVDPKSDLFGRIEVGDRGLSFAGRTFCNNPYYLGNEDTLVDITIQRQSGQIQQFQVHRHPVSWFSPEWHSRQVRQYY